MKTLKGFLILSALALALGTCVVRPAQASSAPGIAAAPSACQIFGAEKEDGQETHG